MLRELRIRNFAVIERVAVPFEAGFNVLSGETGAGKSMLIDALLLLGGARAQTDVIRADEETALVEGVFDVDGEALRILSDAGLAADDGQIVIRRELVRSGRHRAFVNDSPVTVTLLERLGTHLVEVHGQHEQQHWLEPARQLDLLDRFADAEALRALVEQRFAEYRTAGEELERSRAVERDRAQREDLLRFQLAELDAARLRQGEEEELRIERRRLLHAERLLKGLSEVAALLHEDPDAAVTRLRRAARLLQELGRLDPAFAAPAEALEVAAVHTEEALGELRPLRDTASVEPGRLEAIDERLDVLARLKRKYGDTEGAMLALRESAATELDRLARHDEMVAEQERVRARRHAELVEAADALSDRRRGVAGRLQGHVEREVRALGMERAEFGIAIDGGSPNDLTARGWDRVEFRLSANPGEAPRPLARIASGGELSRTMLALHAVLAAADGVPTMVFDEVDAGIGGRIAGVVGEKLAAVARHRQVLSVTHLAQIAARADRHVRVRKAVRNGRTYASVAVLDEDARVTELAGMLGGDTKVALSHARELLHAARRPGGAR
jgi:DNA repair protein RecN (Recombination protein N)